MAYQFDPSIIARLLQGVGPALSAYGAGNPNFGAVGAQAFSDFDRQRRETARDKLQTDLAQNTLAQQQKAQAEAERVKQAQLSAFNRLLPPVAQQSPDRPMGAGPGPGQASIAPPANPLLTGMRPEQIEFLKAYGLADPGGALSMIGQQAFKDPKTPEPPVVKDFYEGGNIVQKQWNPQTGEWSVVGQGQRWAPVQPPSLPADVQEYLFAKRQDPSIGTYAQWKKEQGGGDLRYGLNPVYGKDEDGNTVLLLPNNQGGITKVQTPDGVTIAPQAQFLNTGTAQIPVDRRTGQPIPDAPAIPIDVAGEKSQVTQGEAQGKVAAALPDTIAGAELALKTIEDLRNDPARQAATGMSALVTNKIPGTPAYDYVQKVEQAKGQVFRQVYETLRGGGAITEMESGKAQQALARLDTAQTEQGFLQALTELEAIIKAGAERAAQKAASGPQLNQPQQPTPAVPSLPPPPPGFEVVP